MKLDGKNKKNQIIIRSKEMIKMKFRNGKNWTTTEITKLVRMYRSGRLPVKQIASRLDRTYSAVVKKAERVGLTFKKK